MTREFDAAVLTYTSTTGVYWALEDAVSTTTAADSSGNGHTLSCSSFTFGTTGIVPTDPLTCAATTTGSSGTNSSYTPSFSAVTIGCVVNFTSLPSSGNFAYPFYSNNSQIQISSAGIANAQINNGSTNHNVSQTVALVTGHSYLLIATWNGTTITFYQYDLTANSSPSPVTVSLSSGTFSTGGSTSVAGNTQPMNLGRVFVLPVALTTAQANSLGAAAGSPFDALINSYTSTTGVYWPLEDASGTTTAIDASGNGHTLSASSFSFGTASIVPTDAATCAALTGSSNGSNSSYAPSLTHVTVGCIFNFPTVPASGTFPNIMASQSGNSGVTLYVTGTTGFPTATFGNGTSLVFGPTQSTPVVAGHSYLLVLTWDGTTVSLYQYDLTTSGSSPVATTGLSGGTFTAPSGWSVGDYSFTGDVGRFFVLPLSLSSTQVLALAVAGGLSNAANPNQGLLLSLL
jgi:hypothetical protein